MSTIANRRLANQHLIRTSLNSPEEVVSWFGAVQGQEYLLAKWALGLRLDNTSDHQIEQAFNEGKILRTHAMRPTWHFVTPEDIRWIQKLTAHRVHQINAYMGRQQEIDDALLARCADIIAKALEGGKQLTRSELADELTQAGIEGAKGVRLAYFVMYAELECVICSGALRGKQHTYALMDERAPSGRNLADDEALAELTRRFFTSHGPAMVEDFVFWSGLTKTTAREGLDMVSADIVPEEFKGKTYYASPEMTIPDHVTPVAYLLPPYDEYGIAYRDSSDFFDEEFLKLATERPIFNGLAVYDGYIIGNWKRTIQKNKVLIEFAPFRPFSEVEMGAIAIAAQAFGDFLGLRAEIV